MFKPRKEEIVLTGVKSRSSRRCIPITPVLHEVLCLQEDKTGFVVKSRNTGDRPSNPDSFRKILMLLSEEAGIRRMTPHIIRRSYASLLANGNTPLSSVQRLLGHTGVRITADYCVKATHAANQQTVYLVLKFNVNSVRTCDYTWSGTYYKKHASLICTMT